MNWIELNRVDLEQKFWWKNLACYDIVWYDVVWYDMIWYDMALKDIFNTKEIKRWK